MNEPIKINPGQKIEVDGKIYLVFLNRSKQDIFAGKPVAELKHVEE